MITLSMAIKTLRDQLEWSQSELAAVIGVSTRTIARYEAGSAPSSVTIFAKLAKLARDTDREDLAEVFRGYFSEGSRDPKLHREEDAAWLEGLAHVLKNRAPVSTKPDIVGELQRKIIYALRRIDEASPESGVRATLAECEASLHRQEFEQQIGSKLYELFNLGYSSVRPFEELWASLTSDFSDGYRQRYTAMEWLLIEALKDPEQRDPQKVHRAMAVIDLAPPMSVHDWREKLRGEIFMYFNLPQPPYLIARAPEFQLGDALEEK